MLLWIAHIPLLQKGTIRPRVRIDSQSIHQPCSPDIGWRWGLLQLPTKKCLEVINNPWSKWSKQIMFALCWNGVTETTMAGTDCACIHGEWWRIVPWTLWNETYSFPESGIPDFPSGHSKWPGKIDEHGKCELVKNLSIKEQCSYVFFKAWSICPQEHTSYILYVPILRGMLGLFLRLYRLSISPCVSNADGIQSNICWVLQ